MGRDDVFTAAEARDAAERYVATARRAVEPHGREQAAQNRKVFFESLAKNPNSPSTNILRRRYDENVLCEALIVCGNVHCGVSKARGGRRDEGTSTVPPRPCALFLSPLRVVIRTCLFSWAAPRASGFFSRNPCRSAL